MNTTTMTKSTHPLVIIAAIAVTVFSAVGVAALMGWLPSSKGQTTAEQPLVSEAKPAESAATAAAAPERAPAAAPAARAPARHVARAPAAHNTPHAPTQVAAAEPQAMPEPAPLPPVAQAPVPPAPPVAAEPPRCNNCAVVESVRTVVKEGDVGPVGVGSVAGTVLGGVLGHQVGSGRGRDVATVVGAVGGAIAGHQIEKNRARTTSYEIAVRFDDGSTQRITQAEAPIWHQGDRVRVVNGGLRPL
jgi:outer membrane lipoprotein SlyB